MSDPEAFRAEVRAWLEANCPPEMREPVRDEGDVYWGGRDASFKSDAQKNWFEACRDKGYVVPEWPTEYGGGGLSPAEGKILRQEMARIGARPPLSSFGIWMLGPALLKFGTEGQKRHFLTEIANGEIRWCQGYSEPGSGSDLVSMQTFGEDRGDHWVVNGQKIWTSYADEADWIFCLVRTDKANKYQGITFMLFDMAGEGCRTKPIRLISGNSPFCETFMDDVKVPKSYGDDIPGYVGEINRGWDVAKYLLGHEREMISGAGGGDRTSAIGAAMARMASKQGYELDPVLRAELAMFDVDALAYGAMGEKFLDEMKVGKGHPAQPNMMKYVGTELNKQRHELMMAAGGSRALEWESEDTGGGKPSRGWLRTKANSIEGGTSEVMLNVVAKRILDLPGRSRLDATSLAMASMMQQPHTFFEGVLAGGLLPGAPGDSQLAALLVPGETPELATEGENGCALFTSERLLVGDQAGLLSKRLRVRVIRRDTITAYMIDPDSLVTLQLLGAGFGRATLMFETGFDPMLLSRWLGETLIVAQSKETF